MLRTSSISASCSRTPISVSCYLSQQFCQDTNGCLQRRNAAVESHSWSRLELALRHCTSSTYHEMKASSLTGRHHLYSDAASLDACDRIALPQSVMCRKQDNEQHATCICTSLSCNNRNRSRRAEGTGASTSDRHNQRRWVRLEGGIISLCFEKTHHIYTIVLLGYRQR
jgi:hypothetical protein